MVIGDEFRLLQLAFGGIGNHGSAPLKSGEQGRLGNAIEYKRLWFATDESYTVALFFAPEIGAMPSGKDRDRRCGSYGEGKQAQRLSGQHHTVRPSTPSFREQARPIRRCRKMNGTNALPVRKRIFAPTRHALYRDRRRLHRSRSLLALGGIAIHMLGQFSEFPGICRAIPP